MTKRRGHSARGRGVTEVFGWQAEVPGRHLPDYGEGKRPGAGELDWRQSGACVSMDPDGFYPAYPGAPGEAEALAACAACPVREQCLEWATAAAEPYGIWGGTTETDRHVGRPSGVAIDQARVVLAGSPLCGNGRHLRTKENTRADGRCLGCRREAERRRSGWSGLGRGRTLEPRERDSSGKFARADKEMAA